MNAVWPLVLLGVAGLLLGGAYSMIKQGASKVGIALVGLLGLLSAAGGLLWLLPEA
jgi:hypothetical protein